MDCSCSSLVNNSGVLFIMGPSHTTQRQSIDFPERTDARLAGTVLPPFTSVAHEGFLTRTNDLIADDAGIHEVVTNDYE